MGAKARGSAWLHVAGRVRVDPVSGCWIWRGPKSANGYGHVMHGKQDHLVHRLVYTHFRGAPDAAQHLDHLCRVRLCCNPWHLEAVTPRENVLRGVSSSAQRARQTHCKYGHEFTEENTGRKASGRYCRACEKTRAVGRIRPTVSGVRVMLVEVAMLALERGRIDRVPGTEKEAERMVEEYLAGEPRRGGPHVEERKR